MPLRRTELAKKTPHCRASGQSGGPSASPGSEVTTRSKRLAEGSPCPPSSACGAASVTGGERQVWPAHLPPPARRWSCRARCSGSRCPCLRSGPPSPPAGGSARRGTRTLRTGHCAGGAGAGRSRWRWGRAWRGCTRRPRHHAPHSRLPPAAPPPGAGWLQGRGAGPLAGGVTAGGSEPQVQTGQPQNPCVTADGSPLSPAVSPPVSNKGL